MATLGRKRQAAARVGKSFAGRWQVNAATDAKRDPKWARRRGEARRDSAKPGNTLPLLNTYAGWQGMQDAAESSEIRHCRAIVASLCAAGRIGNNGLLGDITAEVNHDTQSE